MFSRSMADFFSGRLVFHGGVPSVGVWIHFKDIQDSAFSGYDLSHPS